MKQPSGMAELYRAGEPPGCRYSGATASADRFPGLDFFVGPVRFCIKKK